VARLENWSEGPQIPLSSSPFASEIPPPIAPLPEPSTDSDKLTDALRHTMSVNAAAIAKASAQRPRRSANLIWVVLAILVAVLVGYVAHR